MKIGVMRIHRGTATKGNALLGTSSGLLSATGGIISDTSKWSFGRLLNVQAFEEQKFVLMG
jgi:hypothetical protein